MFWGKNTATSQKRPWLRRRERWLALVFILLLLSFGGLYSLKEARQHRLDLADTLAEEIQQHFDTVLVPVVPQPSHPPAAVTPTHSVVTGDAIIALFKELEEYDTACHDAEAAGCIVNTFHWWEMNTDECAVLHAFLARQAPVLEELLAMLEGDIRSSALESLYQPLDDNAEYDAFYNALQVIRLQVSMSLSEGDLDEALRYLMATMRITEEVYKLPLPFPSWAEQFSFHCMERNIIAVLASGACSADQLQAIAARYTPDRHFLQEEMRDWHEWGLKVYEEPARFLENIGDHFLERFVPGISEVMLNTSDISGWNDLDKPMYMEYTQEALGIVELPYPERITAAMAYYKENRRKPLCAHRLSTILAKNYARQICRDAEDAVGRQATQTALAMEQYRLYYGERPASLDLLVPTFLDALPVDPFTGETLRYQPQENGYILYSVGYDRSDNGGVRPEYRFDPFREAIEPGDIVLSFPQAPIDH